jgi:hypothetical protein
MAGMKSIIHYTVLAGTLALWLTVSRVSATASTVSPDTFHQITSTLQDGDLIFIRQINPIFLRVAEITRSWETHVGIIFSGPDGTWLVAESRFPRSKITPLKQFIERSEHGRCAITRYQAGLSAAEKEQLRRSAGERMGRWYDLGFNYDSRRLYCSKLVFDVYQEAAGVQVGALTTFRELLTENPQAPLGFWRAWFLGRIPWDRRCVTTTSELKSPEFLTVYDSAVENKNVKEEMRRPQGTPQVNRSRYSTGDGLSASFCFSAPRRAF